ncbi:hypothetical protein [Desulfobacter hydrogenophilus]|nr:hypothetical protein [Desulfobacter hydrogenophilus]
MPNHTHLIAVSARSDGLVSGIGEAHIRYARMVNVHGGFAAVKRGAYFVHHRVYTHKYQEKL